MTFLENMETITLGNPYTYKTHESLLSGGTVWQEEGKPTRGCSQTWFWMNGYCKSFMKAQMIYHHIEYNTCPPPLKSTTLFIHIMVLSHSYLGGKKTNGDLLFRGKRRLSWLKCLSLFPPYLPILTVEYDKLAPCSQNND